MATQRNQLIAQTIGTGSADCLELWLAEGHSIATIATFMGTHEDVLAGLLAEPDPDAPTTVDAEA